MEDLKKIAERLHKEIEKKRHNDMSEKQDVIIGLLAKISESLDEINSSINKK